MATPKILPIDDNECYEVPDYFTLPIGIWNHLLATQQATLGQANLLALINRLAISGIYNEVGGCYASRKFLATKCRMTLRQVNKYIARWIKEGIIQKIGPYLPPNKTGGKAIPILITSWTHCFPLNGQPKVEYARSFMFDRSHKVLKNKNKRSVLPNASAPKTKTKERTMPFSKEETITPKKEKEWLRLATLLKEATQEAFFYRSSARLKTWADSVRLTEKDQLGDSGRVRKVLEWYAANCKQLGKPRVVTPKQIRSCFSWISDLYNKRVPDVVISKEAKRVLSHREDLGWPKGSKADLPIMIQVSLDNFSDWYNRLSLLKDIDKKWSRDAASMLDSTHGSVNFVLTWVRLVHERVANWDKWNGKLMDWAFKEDHKMFTEMGRGWMRERCGDPKRWDQLMEQING